MEEIRWGIIGCGDVTEIKSGPAFNKVQGSKLVAVMRRNSEKAADYAIRHNIPRWYDDAEKLIIDPDINAIYVATPPSSHAEYTIKALQAGKPVYVEKPMASSYQECLEMNRVAEQTGVPLFVAYYRRSLPYFLKVRELLESGYCGKIRMVSIKLFQPPRQEDLDRSNLPWRVIRDIAGGGYFYDMGSHQLDLMYYMFGEAEEISGNSYNLSGLYDVEDTVSANMVFRSGVVLNGLWSFTVHESATFDMVEIVGEKGRIQFSTFAENPVIIDSEELSENFDIPHPENIQYCLIRDVVNALKGAEECPSTGLTGAYTNWMMDKILNH
jgi:predicted dehydrogenase